MANLVVRNLDPRIVDALKQRAARHGRSAEAKIRNSLIRAAIQMRREKHLRDPFGLPDTLRKPVENPVENSEKIGAHSGAHPSEHDGAHHRGALTIYSRLLGHTPAVGPEEELLIFSCSIFEIA